LDFQRGAVQFGGPPHLVMDPSTEIPKAYEPAAVEARWQALWMEAGCFAADPARVSERRPAFSIVMPPPNITGVLTLGHVLNLTIQDILARRARQTGHEVLWLPGADHAGLATQSAVEKSLRKNEKLSRHDLGRDEFIRRTWEWRETHGRIITAQIKKLGASCDWSRERFTLDTDYAAAVQRVFVELHAKGCIYRGQRMVNWDPAALTALSDEEVIPTPQKSTLYYVRYEVVEAPGTFIEVATTRPETLMGDTALAVHPDDERYRALIGQHVWRPFPRAELPIIGDAQIDPKFGTGALKVTPAHDKTDFEIGQRHGLAAIEVLHPHGKINCPAVPELDGLDRFAARKHAALLLAERGLLAKEEPYENNVGFSERSEVPIEPRLSIQWFLKYPKTAEALAVVREHLIRFFPAHWEKVYAQWLENIQDWCISRQVWWGHRVPAWYGPDAEIRVQIESPGPEWTQDADTLDTWFSSWLWAYETMDAPTRAKFYPTDVLVTGPDIIFFWVARMIIAGLEFQPGGTDRAEDNIPFRNVYFTGLIRDARGKKMSKSLGNSPDVLDLMARYGADGVRFGLLRIAPQGQDIRFDEKQIEEGRNFANKIWNAARLYQMQEPALPFGTRVRYRPAPYVLDIEAKLRAAHTAIEAAYRDYKFSEAAQRLYDFFWSDYCDWFVEAAKADILGVESVRETGQPVTERAIAKHVAIFTMYRVLTEFLRLLHPFMPHLTEELAERLSFPPRPAVVPEGAPERLDKDLSAPAEDGAAGSGETRPRRKSQFLMNQRLGGPISLSGSPEEVAAAQTATGHLYETVRAARNLRAEYQIATNKPARFILRLREDLLEDAFALASTVRALTRMINAEELALAPDYVPPRGTPQVLTPLGDLFMPLAGLVDVAAERGRIDKELVKTEVELLAAQRKLDSPQFVENAPAAVVEEHRQRLVTAEARLAKLREMLAALEA
jgi:valyl-tRNA synthetase